MVSFDTFVMTVFSFKTVKLVKLQVKGLSYSETQTGAYALLLREVKGERKLPIIIGGFEAQSIAIALDTKNKPIRPLTHDLFKSFGDRFDIQIKQVIIHKLVDGVFFSSIICERDKIEEIFDSRTSDAIALALRFNAPVFAYDSILKKAGFETSEKEAYENDPVEEEEQHLDNINEIKNLTTIALKSLLNKLVSLENYEQAVKVRDELLNRETKNS